MKHLVILIFKLVLYISVGSSAGYITYSGVDQMLNGEIVTGVYICVAPVCLIVSMYLQDRKPVSL